ncbi:hypothetical protein [Streptomyces sp. NBC_01233]|uniref:hypothetical protein n=1 Tax=Streptomyces sp. NBC_01233 TaxID=2903787 RepID=UPI002E1021DC|nr:hypothetical protein OG332_36155 [Streptomyces sp. NBC_01233]
METATSLAISQLSGYLRGLTQRLDPGAGWYGEFLRRDPEGIRACLEGAAMPPWDVVESLLRDLEGARGTEFAARETVYAARLRAAAVTAWDRLPGGEEELRTLLAASAAQRAEAESALRNLTARLGGAVGPAETDALTRELSWTQDDVARAAARHEDLAARLTSLRTTPLPGVPRQRTTPPEHPHQPADRTHTAPGRPHQPASWTEAPADWSETPAGWFRQSSEGAGASPERPGHPAGWAEAQSSAERAEASEGWTGVLPARGSQSADAAGASPERPGHPAGWAEASDGRTGASSGWAPQRADGAQPSTEPAEAPDGWTEGPPARGGQSADGAGASGGQGPVGRAEGRWLRGGRRSGGARYAGSAAPDVPAFTPPPGQPGTGLPGSDGLGPEHGRPAPRGARFGPPQDPLPRGVRFGRPRPEPVTLREAAPAAVGEAAPHPTAPAGPARAVAAELLALRAQGRSGEAHALLCEAAAGPAERLPGLAAELARAGLAADWATLLWEAGSLPPGQLAAAAAALGDAGREADCDALLRQGVARPAAEVAEAALALGDAGRVREADALLGVFVRVRTAEEAAGLARRDPQWFAPRLLLAARALPGSRHRDLVHALRVAGIGAG